MSKLRQESACGSKESGSPPFPFPPPGASRGHSATRCARAGEGAGQKQSRFRRLRPVRNTGSLKGAPPLAPVKTLYCKADRSRVIKTGHLD